MRQVARASRGVAVPLLIAVLAAACAGPGPGLPLGPFLAQGAFVPFESVTTLGVDPGRRGQPEFWRPKAVLPVAGWGRALRGWRPLGASAPLDLWPAEPGAGELVFEFRRRRSAAALVVSTRVNGEPVGKTALRSGRTRGRHPVPAGALPGANRVELRFEPPLRQPEVGAVELSLTRIGFRPAGRRHGGEREGRSPAVDAGESRIDFAVPGVYLLPLAIPPEASRLVYEARGPEIRLWAIDPEGRRHDLEPAAAGRGTGEPGWSARTADLEALGGRSVFLGLEAAAGDADSRPSVRGLGVQLAREPRTAPPPPSRPAPEPPPDVVLIVLDAARADRFLGRYSRDLTPNIHRLAVESLAFEHAYSDCPNTICSVPNLITGRSFLDTGDVFEGVQLGDRVVTLAESLRGAGYRTVGLSANPNNSAARNGHQGFDDWRELWGRNHLDALAMSEAAAEIVAAQPPGEPLYLQLHYLPPHQPYAPPPRFDLYTDPGYRGGVAPGTPVEVDEFGRTELGPADLEQLVGLYDGNVRLADAAVGRVLEALRTAGRWRNTLLVVTSDHGEAFLEHGYQGHNTTLFDEMLHVPLIFRLPGGERPEGVDTGRLAALSDVVPTVLGYLGLEPAPEVDGLDLLAARPDPQRPRVIYHRTNHRRPLLAARSRAWKLIVRPALGERMLFDLAADPGETVNLAAARPWIYTGLALLLRRQLEVAAGRTFDSIPVELGAEERAVLESLGYVE